MDNDGHLKIEPKLAITFGAALLLAGVACGFFAMQLLPLQSKAAAQADRDLMAQQVGQMQLHITAHDSQLQEIQAWRMDQAEKLGEINASQQEILRRLDAMEEGKRGR